MSAGCPNMRRINLHYCGQVSDVGLRVLSAGCLSVQLIDLSCRGQVSDESFRALCAGCPKLHHLELSYCEQVSDAGLWATSAAARICSALTCLLRAGQRRLSAGCPNARHLKIGFCTPPPTRHGKTKFPDLKLGFPTSHYSECSGPRSMPMKSGNTPFLIIPKNSESRQSLHRG